MTLRDLTFEEDVILLGLMREIIQADGAYTENERKRVEKIRAAIGDARFEAAAEAASKRYSKRDHLKDDAKSIVVPATRAAMFAALSDVAEADGIHESERKPLNWLASWWGLG